MKKIYTVLAVLGVTASMAAQQLPNAGFEDEWTACVPWTSNGNTKTQGTTPSPWIVSNTIGTGTVGKTNLAEQVEGCNSSKAVRLYLKNVLNQIIPGYMSLGTAWSTATGFTGNEDRDGGVFGGYVFSYRPDALAFDYKRISEKEGSWKSSVVAYTWKGEYTQAEVPGNIAIMFFSPKKVTMINRDRNILGIETITGGAVTKSEDAALIAKLEYYIEADQDEWNSLSIPFEYMDQTANPEKINVIFAAGEYFNASPQEGPVLFVDNVKLVYYSRLSGIKFKGVDIEGFDPDNFDYELDEIMPTDENDIEVATMGNSGVAKAEVALDPQKNVATITVSNDHGADADNLAKHVYTVKFLPAGSSIADPSADAADNVRYYNLQGNIVDADALVSGQTYIKVANGVASKIIK